jgi:hypothetical protein
MNENEVSAPEIAAEPSVGVIPDVSEAAPVSVLDAAEDDFLSDAGTSAVETVYVAVPEDRPFMTTCFADYTVTEGLLLLVFLLLVIKSVFDMVWRWF